jgi:hypothetical protein
MRVIVRSVGVALLVIVAAVLLALTSTMTSVFTLAASTYIVGGTQFVVPFCLPFCGNLSTPQQNIDLATPYINGTIFNPPGNPNVVPYPASFWPISVGYFYAPTYDDAVAQGVAALPSPGTIQSGSVIFGYSQGANVATVYKRNFNQYYANNPQQTPPPITFVLIGNGNRPNGGALERFNGLYIPGLDFSFNGATPTTTAGALPGQITTYDIARQYDGFADFPTNPLNLLADANAMMGMVLVHPGYGSVNMSQAVFQGTYGDTAYYMIPTYPLPLLMPVQMIPVVGPIVADTLDPVLRVLVEAGYNRTINPGVPTPASVFYFPNPGTLGISLLVAIPTGLDNGIGDLAGAGIRPFDTTRPDAAHGYVVNGPPLQVDPSQTPPVLPSAPLAPSLAQTAAASPQPAVDTTPAPVTSVANTPAPVRTAGPRLNVLTGGPIGGSPTPSGVNGVASTVNGVFKQTTTAITGAVSGVLNAAVAAAGGAAAAAGGASTSSPKPP